MTDTVWAVLAKPSGTIIWPGWKTDGAHPRFRGLPGWDSATMECRQVTGTYDPATSKLDRTTWTWVEDPTLVEAQLIASVKSLASTAKMKALTIGTAKSKIYAAQQAEINAFYALGGLTQSLTAILAAVLALPAAERERRFRYAQMSAARHGEATIQPAIERFAAGAAKSDREVARIEAIEQFGVEAIKAATTAAAKRAAFAAINWAWTA